MKILTVIHFAFAAAAALALFACKAGVERPQQKPALTLAGEFDVGSAVNASPLIEKTGGALVLYGAGAEGGICAWDIEGEKELWRIKNDISFEASLLIIGDTLYAASLEGDLLAIDAKTGTLLKRASGFGQIKGGLAADGDKRYFYAGSYDNHLYKINASDLSIVWKYASANYINGRAALAGDFVAFGSCDAKLYLLSRKDGSLAASVKGDSYIPSTPAAGGDGTIYFAAYEGEVCAWSPERGILWKHLDDSASPVRSPVTLDGDAIIYGDQRGRVSALAKTDGRVLWHFEGGSPVDFETIVTGAGIITASAEGALYLLDRRSGAELLSYPLGSLPSLGGAWHAPYLAVGTATGKILLFRLESAAEKSK